VDLVDITCAILATSVLCTCGGGVGLIPEIVVFLQQFKANFHLSFPGIGQVLPNIFSVLYHPARNDPRAYLSSLMIIKMEKEKMIRSLVILLVGAASVSASYAQDAAYSKNMVNCNDRTHDCLNRSEKVAEDQVKRPFEAGRDYQRIYKVPALPVPREPIFVVETFTEVSRPVKSLQTVVVKPQDGVKWAYAVRGKANDQE